MARTLKSIFEDYCEENGKMSKELSAQILEMKDLKKLVDQIAINVPLYYEQRQRILEAVDIYERFELLSVLLSNEVEVMHIRHELQNKIKAQVDKNQREYLLREQLKVIREELGEDNTYAEVEHFRDEVKKLKASKEVKERINKEIDRFKNAGNNSAESSVIRGYIETLLELPWDKASKDNQDLKNAKKVLEEDHTDWKK